MMQRANESHSSRNVDTSAVADGTLSDLDKLTVNDNPTPPEKYNRVEQFGPAWKDVDHNGCDTRNDILDRDLTVKDKRNACVVTAGNYVEARERLSDSISRATKNMQGRIKNRLGTLGN